MVRLKLSTNGECIGKFRYLYVRPELLSKGSEAVSHSLSLRSIASLRRTADVRLRSPISGAPRIWTFLNSLESGFFNSTVPDALEVSATLVTPENVQLNVSFIANRNGVSATATLASSLAPPAYLAD